MGKVFFIAALLAISITARAVVHNGPITSGGGGAIVCRDNSGRIQKAILLDLYEAQTLHGYKLPKPTGSLEQDYIRAVGNTYRLQGLPNAIVTERPRISKNIEAFFRQVIPTKWGDKLPQLNDMGYIPPLPQGCHIEQLAIFYDKQIGEIHIDSEIWAALDSMSQAALVSHELAYAEERRFRERTSETTRAFVAAIYAENRLRGTLFGLPKQYVSCSADGVGGSTQWNKLTNEFQSKIVIFPTQTKQGMGYRFQFMQIAGRVFSTVLHTTADFPGLNFQTTNRPGAEPWRSLVSPTLNGVQYHLEVPINGKLSQKMSIELFFESGTPVRFNVKQAGQVVSRQILSHCQ